MLQLFVGTNVTLGSKVMQSFVIGMRSAFTVSIGLVLVAAIMSMVRGRENRKESAPLVSVHPNEPGD
jgi:hypothetical protein